jgi:hypothetical protein
MASLWPWLVVAGLGALHGASPATGWMFAAACGVRTRDAAQARARCCCPSLSATPPRLRWSHARLRRASRSIAAGSRCWPAPCLSGPRAGAHIAAGRRADLFRTLAWIGPRGGPADDIGIALWVVPDGHRAWRPG